MNAIDRLTAIEDIRQLKARYFRCMDTKDWSGLADVFAPDAVFDLRTVDRIGQPLEGEPDPHPGADPAVHDGRDAILAMIRAALDGLVSVHHGHMPEITICSETTATAIWAMEDVIRDPSGTSPFRLHGRGHYHDSYERLDRGWVIKRTAITRLLHDTD